VLAERNEQSVDPHLLVVRHHGVERDRRLLRRPRRDVAPPVGNPVDVDVDADERLATGDPKRQVGAFDPDAVEALNDTGIAGDVAVELLLGSPGDGDDLPNLAIRERAPGRSAS